MKSYNGRCRVLHLISLACGSTASPQGEAEATDKSVPYGYALTRGGGGDLDAPLVEICGNIVGKAFMPSAKNGTDKSVPYKHAPIVGHDLRVVS